MQVRTTPIQGLVELVPTAHNDERGFFSRTFDADVARSAGINPDGFVQDSISRSHRGVVRGLHVRVGPGENKLVRCSSGEIFDVVVDLRRGSPTYGRWVSFHLSGDRQSSIFVPAGCAHGFQALTEPADTSYRIDRAHDPTEDLTVRFTDEDLAIPWPLEVTAVSRKDAEAAPLRDLGEALSRIAPLASPVRSRG